MEVDPNNFKEKNVDKRMPVIWISVIENLGQFTEAKLKWHLKKRLTAWGDAMQIHNVCRLYMGQEDTGPTPWIDFLLVVCPLVDIYHGTASVFSAIQNSDW